ncbi:MAG: glycoside hydrolase family 5 protein [Clostridia bacterium]|nr:glycoside hydrolase family 5 protein [Clostridia bacterium]
MIALALMLTGCLAGFHHGAMAAESGPAIPELKPTKKEMPDNEGLRRVWEMKAGWNLGNTFDAVDCAWLSNPLDYETAWCGARTEEVLMDGLRDAGFKTIRVPVSWHNHVDENLTIDEAWLARVREVVSWALERDLFVILNIHHDCEKGFYYPSRENAERSERYVRTIWTQLAETFRDTGDRLMFECINEPRLKGTDHEWWWEATDPACQEAMAEIIRLNQVFVDTVRGAGGENESRFLLVPAYDASPDYACDPAFTLPVDTVENRMIVSVHAYSPYSFALEQPGTERFDRNNAEHQAGITGFLDALYHRFISNGIPVLIGEFGAMEKNGNLQSRVDWMAFYVSQARARGMTCCWWDNNLFSGKGERFGLFDRKTGECRIPELLETFMKHCE